MPDISPTQASFVLHFAAPLQRPSLSHPGRRKLATTEPGPLFVFSTQHWDFVKIIIVQFSKKWYAIILYLEFWTIFSTSFGSFPRYKACNFEYQK